MRTEQLREALSSLRAQQHLRPSVHAKTTAGPSRTSSLPPREVLQPLFARIACKLTVVVAAALVFPSAATLIIWSSSYNYDTARPFDSIVHTRTGYLAATNGEFLLRSEPAMGLGPLTRFDFDRYADSLSILLRCYCLQGTTTPIAFDLYFPCWLIALLTAVPAAVGIFIARRYHPRIHTAGYCRRCGYDLRGSIERCPECGKPNSRYGPAPSEAAATPPPVQSPVPHQIFPVEAHATAPPSAVCDPPSSPTRQRWRIASTVLYPPRSPTR